jgi:hypothetical protein
MLASIVGSIIAGIGKAGLAGSGVVLDPQQQRRDLEPWQRAAGGMISDKLSEIEPLQKIADGLTRDANDREPVIKVRCRSCQALADEDAKFCPQCGAKI